MVVIRPMRPNIKKNRHTQMVVIRPMRTYINKVSTLSGDKSISFPWGLTFLHFDNAEINICLICVLAICMILNSELLLLYFDCSGNIKMTDKCCVYIRVYQCLFGVIVRMKLFMSLVYVTLLSRSASQLVLKSQELAQSKRKM